MNHLNQAYIHSTCPYFIPVISYLFFKLHLLTFMIKELAIQSKSKWLDHLTVDPKEQSLWKIKYLILWSTVLATALSNSWAGWQKHYGAWDLWNGTVLNLALFYAKKEANISLTEDYSEHPIMVLGVKLNVYVISNSLCDDFTKEYKPQYLKIFRIIPTTDTF